MFIKIIRFLLKALGLLILLLLVVFFVIYAIAPVYKFPEYKAFSGDKIYNPYQGIDSASWLKGNFQVQSRAWAGITDGRDNSNEAIQTIYGLLGYDIIVTSDYMKINRFGEDKTSYIPTYEHGYGIRKTHQVCIGSEKVNWIDYPFYANRNHKQHILNVLRKNNQVVALAHPSLRNGHTLDDMRTLTNYDLIEVLNELKSSIEHWDAALSSGHKVFILSNDDAHDIFDPSEVGRKCTFINSTNGWGSDVVQALKEGKAYGVDIGYTPGSDFVERAKIHKHIPQLDRVTVINDTLTVKVSKKPKRISFIGQNGIIKSTVADTNQASYKIASSDTYIRTEITFDDKTILYLNPVFRYSGSAAVEPELPVIDQTKTWVQRGIALIITIIVLLIVSRLIRSKPKNKGRISRRAYYSYTR
jgi:hypothetical protein